MQLPELTRTGLLSLIPHVGVGEVDRRPAQGGAGRVAVMEGTTLPRPLQEEHWQWVGGGGAQGLPTPTP